MKSIFSLLFLFIYLSSSSLIAKSGSQEPQEKVQSYIDKANGMDNPSTSLIILNQAYQYIYELEDSLEAILYLDLGVSHLALSHDDSANYFLNQTLNLAKKNTYQLLEISALEKLGRVAKLGEEYELATSYYSLASEKRNQLKLNSLQSKKPSNNKTEMIKGGVLFGSILFVILLLYLNISQRKKFKQKEAQWEQKFKILITSSEISTSQKFSLSIKSLNKHLNNPLSQREYDVLCLVVTNNTNTLIADQLFVSVNTVKTHLKNLFEKLDVTNRKEAIQKVINIKSEGLS